MGSENRIQRLNRELRELTVNARKEREEFERFRSRQRRFSSISQERGSADDSSGAGADE